MTAKDSTDRAFLKMSHIGGLVNKLQSQALYEPQRPLLDMNDYASDIASPPLYLLPSEIALDSYRYDGIKRVLDFIFAALMLIFFCIPGVLIAAAIKISSPGPVFYREERIGRHGRSFRIWKFRSMHVNSGRYDGVAGEHFSGNLLSFRMRKHLKDPRITAIGHYLRRWSIDEVPQLINVFRGEMSFIGPRPIIEAETPFYERHLAYYLAATPGMSGLWQISGRSNVDYPKRAELDATYVKTWSLLADFKILLGTVPAVIKRTGAL